MQYYYVLYAVATFFGVIMASDMMRIKIGKRITNQRKLSCIYLTLVFFAVSFLIGFRDISVGVDSRGYVNEYFYKVRSIGIFTGNAEIVLNLLAWISLQFSQNYQGFFIISGIVISYAFGKFIYDNSSNVYLSVSIFLGVFFVQSMNLTREWLAIGIGLNALTMYRREKYKSAFFLIIMAILTHTTAVSLLFIPVIENVKNKKKLLAGLLVFCVLFYIGRNSIFSLMVRFVPRYSGYLNMQMFLGDGGFNIKDLIFIIFLAYYVYWVVFNSQKITENEYDKYCEYIAFLMLALTFSLCGRQFSIAHRLVYYYSSFLIISIPEIIRKSKFRTVISIMLVVGMFVMLFRNSISDNNGISNYVFFWTQR